MVRRNTYKKPIRYYKCGGMLRHRLDCREHGHLRAEPIEELVWNEVVKILESPEMVTSRLMPDVEGPDRDRLLAEVKSAETDLRRIESEEDRLIRLLVSGKIIEPQFHRRRKFIVERLETAREIVASTRGRLETIEKAVDLGDAAKA